MAFNQIERACWGFARGALPAITVFSSDLITEIPHAGWV
jgi:hypothetical protein